MNKIEFEIVGEEFEEEWKVIKDSSNYEIVGIKKLKDIENQV